MAIATANQLVHNLDQGANIVVDLANILSQFPHGLAVGVDRVAIFLLGLYQDMSGFSDDLDLLGEQCLLFRKPVLFLGEPVLLGGESGLLLQDEFDRSLGVHLTMVAQKKMRSSPPPSRALPHIPPPRIPRAS